MHKYNSYLLGLEVYFGLSLDCTVWIPTEKALAALKNRLPFGTSKNNLTTQGTQGWGRKHRSVYLLFILSPDKPLEHVCRGPGEGSISDPNAIFC